MVCIATGLLLEESCTVYDDLTSNKMSRDGLLTCQQDCAPLSMFEPWTYSMGAVGFQWLLPLPRVASGLKTLTIDQFFC